MAAGLRNQRIATARLALPPSALAGLVGVALFVGALLGVAAKSEIDTMAGSRVAAPATASSLESRLLTARAQIIVGRGPLVRDPGATGVRPQPAARAVDHVGLTERLIPVTTPHPVEHGPLP